MLADLQVRHRTLEDARKRNVRRIYAGVGVAIIHVLFVGLLLASEWIPIVIPNVRKIEALQWVTLSQPAHAPRQVPVKLRSQNAGAVNPDIIPQLPRPKAEEENNAITDFGLALGRSLACGANSYEWLNSKMRAECKHRPWNFTYDRYGNIVLDATPRLPRDTETLRPSDVQAHERNTAPVCPRNIDPNAPCLSAVIGGGR
jgi:hypothetical protein